MLFLVASTLIAFSSGNEDFAKVETISIGVYSNFSGQKDYEFKNIFKEKISELNYRSPIKIVSGNEYIEKSRLSDSFLAINLHLKRECSENNDYCALAIFPVGLWTGGDLFLGQCRFVEVFENKSEDLDLYYISDLVKGHITNCVLNTIFEETKR